MRKLTVLGIQLKDYSVREAMRRITLYLNNGLCNTVDFVTHDTLLKASGDASMKDGLESMDMVVLTSNDILETAGVHSRSREKEIESNLFLKGLLRKLSKEGRPVFLISSTPARVESLTESLHGFFGQLNIAGSVALDDVAGGDDFVVNEINSSLPDVVIMNLDSPAAEDFIRENKMKLNVQLLVIVRDAALKMTSDGNVKKGGIGDFLLKRLFKNAADNYDKENKDLDL